jgi:hypothetical protein
VHVSCTLEQCVDYRFRSVFDSPMAASFHVVYMEAEEALFWLCV